MPSTKKHLFKTYPAQLKWNGPLDVVEPWRDPLWTLETEHWYAAVHYEKGWGFCYTVTLSMDKGVKICDNFCLREHDKHIIKQITLIKAAVESIFKILDKANSPGNTWMAKCVMMGAISEAYFQYYAVEGQPK